MVKQGVFVDDGGFGAPQARRANEGEKSPVHPGRKPARRAWIVGLAALGVGAVLLGFSAFAWPRLATQASSGDAFDPSRRWEELPPAPLSPRAAGLAVGIGTRALFVGGEIAHHCPPNAGCVRSAEYAVDGAAFDPATGTWSRIADAPVPVATYTPQAVVDHTLVIMGSDHTWHAYDMSEDTWRSLPDPPVRTWGSSEALTGGEGAVFTLSRRGRIATLDLATNRWSTLPASPHQPRLELQSVQWSPSGLVAIGVDSTAVSDGTKPSYLLAERYADGKWTRFARSDMVGGYVWSWTGERLVSPDTYCVDGGETNPYPRCIPMGGLLDPSTGTWSELPAAPEGAPVDPQDPLLPDWALTGEGKGRVLAGGLLYDDTTGAWSRLGAPEGFQSLIHVSAAVAGDSVIALGGIDWSNGDGKTTNQAWIWKP